MAGMLNVPKPGRHHVLSVSLRVRGQNGMIFQAYLWVCCRTWAQHYAHISEESIIFVRCALCATHPARPAACQAGLVIISKHYTLRECGLVGDNLIDIGPGACNPSWVWTRSRRSHRHGSWACARHLYTSQAGGCFLVHCPHLISCACPSSPFWQSGWLCMLCRHNAGPWSRMGLICSVLFLALLNHRILLRIRHLNGP